MKVVGEVLDSLTDFERNIYEGIYDNPWKLAFSGKSEDFNILVQISVLPYERFEREKQRVHASSAIKQYLFGHLPYFELFEVLKQKRPALAYSYIESLGNDAE